MRQKLWLILKEVNVLYRIAGTNALLAAQGRGESCTLVSIGIAVQSVNYAILKFGSNQILSC